MSYASYRLAPILRECLNYSADLFVICTGHNEFLEDRTYASIKSQPGWERWIREHASHSRVYQLLRASWHQFRSSGTTVYPTGSDPDPDLDPESNRSLMTAEVDALLDYRDGLAAYHRDIDWQDRVIDHFRSNLLRMIRMAEDGRVPCMMLLPPSNLRDCPPFKSQHRDGMTAAELGGWNMEVESARALFRESPKQAIEHLNRAIQLDPEYALAHYELGKCHESIAQFAPAAQAYRLARDLDVCPLRMLSRMESIIETICSESGTTLIDARRLLETLCSWQMIGNEVLVDHVHPSITSHQIIGRELARAMADEGFLEMKSDSEWVPAANRAFERQLNSLEPIYFLHGKRRLRNLEAWTQGRADGLPIEMRYPNLKEPGSR